MDEYINEWNTQKIYICISLKNLLSVSRSVISDSLRPYGLPWNSPGKITGVGCHSFLHGIFENQGSNPGLLHSKQILYHLSYQGSLKNITHIQFLRECVCVCVCVCISLKMFLINLFLIGE